MSKQEQQLRQVSLTALTMITVLTMCTSQTSNVCTYYQLLDLALQGLNKIEVGNGPFDDLVVRGYDGTILWFLTRLTSCLCGTS